ncbi:MAG: MFS transporter, partial [Candidatus Natronoplasma sp.]
YFSWRWVFILYGLMELLALIMIYKELMNTDIQGLSTNFISYLKLLKRSKISRLIPLILINGFIVYGSFAYLGSHLREVYGFSYITVGFILSFFGLSAFALGKRSGIMREKMSSFIILFLG